MKSLTFFAFFSLFFALVSCSFNSDKPEQFSDVVQYNDHVVDCINAIDTAYSVAVASDNGLDEALRLSDSLIEVCDDNLMKMGLIRPFQNDSTLCEQGKKFAMFMRKMAQNEIREYHKVYEEYLNSSAEEEEEIGARLDNLADLLNNRYEVEMNKVQTVQTKLSKKFNFRILD